MAEQPFERLLEGDPPLLRSVEAIVVGTHREWYLASGGSDWSEPKAYHWLCYEDPDRVARLADGVRRLQFAGVQPPQTSVEAAFKLSQKR